MLESCKDQKCFVEWSDCPGLSSLCDYCGEIKQFADTPYYQGPGESFQKIKELWHFNIDGKKI